MTDCCRVSGYMETFGQAYDENAVVPKAWRNSNVTHLRTWQGEREVKISDVFFGRSTLGKHPIVAKHSQFRRQVQDRSEIFSSQLSKSAVDTAEEWLRTRVSDQYFKRLGLLHTQKNALTNTFDFDVGKFVGVHIDDWSGLPSARRSAAPFRILINLAEERRLFILCDCLFENTPIQEDHSHISLTNLFRASVGSSVPALVVPLEPGDWVILHAETVPHDGSTLGTIETGFAYTGHLTYDGVAEFLTQV